MSSARIRHGESRNLSGVGYCDLPQEIRDVILKNVFADLGTRHCKVMLATCWPSNVTHSGTLMLELPSRAVQLFVSKQFLKEALPIFMAELRLEVRECTISDWVEWLRGTRSGLYASVVKQVLLRAQELTVTSHDRLVLENTSHLGSPLVSVRKVSFNIDLLAIWVWEYERSHHRVVPASERHCRSRIVQVALCHTTQSRVQRLLRDPALAFDVMLWLEQCPTFPSAQKAAQILNQSKIQWEISCQVEVETDPYVITYVADIVSDLRLGMEVEKVRATSLQHRRDREKRVS